MDADHTKCDGTVDLNATVGANKNLVFRKNSCGKTKVSFNDWKEKYSNSSFYRIVIKYDYQSV